MLDNAVFVFGTTLKAELENVDGKTEKEITRKRDRVLRRWLPEAAGSPGKFRDPANRG